MTIDISLTQARHFLATYHFTQTKLPGVFERLGTVQYDPLNPIGRNPDLVFQARVPGYQVDDWQQVAYTDRLIYDAWDKQACLVPISDWPLRARVREHHRPYHDREVLQTESEVAEMILATIDTQGPMSSLEFEDRTRSSDNNSWYGLTRTKRVLRALWACGELLTHHRKSGRHYYDRPERVIPPQYYNAPPLLDEDAYHCWIILRRFQAAGLLRPTAEPAIWSACGDGPTRKRAIAQLVEEGTLTSVRVGEKGWPYYMPTSALPLLDAAPPAPRVIFLGPLDNLLWDRKGILQLFDFDYAWEVYKPAEQRRWGYYVIPVFYGDRFIARLDSRLDKGIWTISRWWWEPDVTPDAALLDALHDAIAAFLHYLRADDVRVEDGVDKAIAHELIDKTS
ncbi:MAG: YcaQ family DNA glycosylase [Chloroflexi bacterium]|nr:YcaQ family DNA glycosylase [Chloroflexota bacterium]